jgi:hypothetical protein
VQSLRETLRSADSQRLFDGLDTRLATTNNFLQDTIYYEKERNTTSTSGRQQGSIADAYPGPNASSEAARSLDPACRAMVTREGAGLQSTFPHTLQAIFDTRFIVSFVPKAMCFTLPSRQHIPFCIPSLDSSVTLERYNTTNTSTMSTPTFALSCV